MQNKMKKYVEGGPPLELSLFKAPPSELYPTYSWIWNTRITKKGITDGLDNMKKAGIRSFYLLPLPKDFSPRNNATDMEPEYLSDGFMELVRFAAEYAKSIGLSMWMYDEGGWPSGMACGQVVRIAPHTAAKKITRREKQLKAGDTYSIGDALCAYVGTERISDGFCEKNDVTVTEYFASLRTYPYAKDPNAPHYQDAANAEATDIFLELTYDRYKKALGNDFGEYVGIAFTDEPAIRYPAWTEGIDKLYFEKYGEDIYDILPELFENGGDGQSRIRFCKLLTEQFRKNYFERIRARCEKYGVYFAGHMNMDHTLAGEHMNHYGSQVAMLRELDIPGIDVIWRQIYRSEKPVSDGGYPFFPRIAPSAANQSGKNLAVTESFAIYGNGLNGDDIRYVANYQIIRGINVINCMTVPYSTKGSYAFTASPVNAKDTPGFFHGEKINSYLARLCYLATLGRRDADTALIAPVDDILAMGERERAAAESFEDCGVQLESRGIDFDIIDEQGLEKGVVENGELRLGNARYKSVVLPENVTLGSGLLQKLSGLLQKTPEPLFSGDFEKLRVMRRRLSDGYLYFIYNEDTKSITTDVNITGRHLYRLDCVYGRVLDFSRSVTIESGDILVVFDSENELDCEKEPCFTQKTELCDFEVRKHRELLLSKDGMSSYVCSEEFEKTELGHWKYEKEFSGEVCYRTGFDLCSESRGIARLSFGRVCHSARVAVNGTFVGIIAFSPWSLEFDASLLRRGRNVIEIYVCNTAANAYSAYDPTKDFDPRFLALGYAERSREFEKDSFVSGLFGPAVLEI